MSESETTKGKERPLVFRRVRFWLIGRPVWIFFFATIYLFILLYTLIALVAMVVPTRPEWDKTEPAEGPDERVMLAVLFVLDILPAYPLAAFIVEKVEITPEYCRERTLWGAKTAWWKAGLFIAPRYDWSTGPLDLLNEKGEWVFRLRPLRYARPFEMVEAIRGLCPGWDAPR